MTVVHMQNRRRRGLRERKGDEVSGGDDVTMEQQEPVIVTDTQYNDALQQAGLRVVKCAADGSCFYRAISRLLHGNELSHAELRASVVDHIVRPRCIVTNATAAMSSAVSCVAAPSPRRLCAVFVSRNGRRGDNQRVHRQYVHAWGMG